MRCASGDAIVGACERPRTLLDQISLLRIGPVAEFTLGAETQHRRATHIHFVWIAQAALRVARIKNLRCVGTFRNLGGGRIEPAHILVDVRGNTLACLEDDDPSPTFTELVSNQRAGKARADDGDIPQYFVNFPSHGLAPSVHATTNEIADLVRFACPVAK